jgi:hypothetical protein
MGGSLLQLVAYGAQDIYLTGNPQITFFKVVYKRHTNFSIEAIDIPSNTNYKLGSSILYNIQRYGDLLSQVILEITWDSSGVPASWRLGHQIIDYIDIEIGSQRIDRQYGTWMDIWAQLTNTNEDMEKLSTMLSGKLNNKFNKSKIYIPLQFWFCRNPGLALPIIALQYHEVKINIVFNSNYVYADPSNPQKYIYSSSNSSSPSIFNIALYCDFIFLDTDERRLFTQNSHEYLIEQIQFSNKIPITNLQTQINLEFSHPVKELVWAVQREYNTDNSPVYPFDFWAIDGVNNYTIDMVNSAKLQFNLNDRFKERDGTYFRCVQPYQYHTGGNKQVGYISPIPVPYYDYLVEPFGGFYVYSFALKPEEHQPSGSCNFSRIDNATLILDLNSQAKFISIWAINYNVLRIMSGMGGVAYSN